MIEEIIQTHGDKNVIAKSADGNQITKLGVAKDALRLFEDALFTSYFIENNHVVIIATDDFFNLQPGLS